MICPKCNMELSQEDMLDNMFGLANVGEYGYHCKLCGTPLKLTIVVRDVQELSSEEEDSAYS